MTGRGGGERAGPLQHTGITTRHELKEFTNSLIVFKTVYCWRMYFLSQSAVRIDSEWGLYSKQMLSNLPGTAYCYCFFQCYALQDHTSLLSPLAFLCCVVSYCVELCCVVLSCFESYPLCCEILFCVVLNCVASCQTLPSRLDPREMLMELVQSYFIIILLCCFTISHFFRPVRLRITSEPVCDWPQQPNMVSRIQYCFMLEILSKWKCSLGKS